MPEHRDIVDAQLHQPKGASTALEGQLMRAKGDGTIEWKYPPEGWGSYKHSTTQVFDNTFSKLTIDGLSAASIQTYLPREIRGSGQLWDVVTNKITPITIGDVYEIRLDLPITAESGSPVEITVELDIGGTASPTNVIVERYAATGRATPYSLSFAFPVYTGSTFVPNGGQIFIKTNTGSITTTGAGITIVRLTAGDW